MFPFNVEAPLPKLDDEDCRSPIVFKVCLDSESDIDEALSLCSNASTACSTASATPDASATPCAFSRRESAACAVPIEPAAGPRCCSDRQQRRARRKNKQKEAVAEYLLDYGFRDINEPRAQTVVQQQEETIYPIHLAAQQGNVRMVRALLEGGADPTQESSLGRSAHDFALLALRKSAQEQVLRLLELGPPKKVTLREFCELAAAPRVMEL
mmetsp:Transcript_100214/g.238970  ORF Transcript_100214/g.238970 Transcript_100214/m.238970 type:complete len:212 (+) Transcript_100214:31-666(+)